MMLSRRLAEDKAKERRLALAPCFSQSFRQTSRHGSTTSNHKTMNRILADLLEGYVISPSGTWTARRAIPSCSDKGDLGAELRYLQRGAIRLEKIGTDVHSGAIFGKFGIFSATHARTCGAVCATDVDLFTLTSGRVKRLYLLNLQFALYVVHFFAIRLMANRSRVI
jgi:hypothetical protein